MKLPIQLRVGFAAASVLVLVGGCASMRAGAPAATGSRTEPMDMQGMCEKHKQMMAGKSPQEQQAMMQEHMKTMSPEMRQRMQAMMQQCR